MKQPKMSSKEIMRAYHDAWKSYYSTEHMLTLMKRRKERGKRRRIALSLIWFCNSIFIEGVHPLMGGFVRLKGRKSRRPGFPVETIPVYYLKRFLELFVSLLRFGFLTAKVCTLWYFAAKSANAGYSDEAIAPIVEDKILPRKETVFPESESKDEEGLAAASLTK